MTKLQERKVRDKEWEEGPHCPYVPSLKEEEGLRSPRVPKRRSGGRGHGGVEQNLRLIFY